MSKHNRERRRFRRVAKRMHPPAKSSRAGFWDAAASFAMQLLRLHRASRKSMGMR